MLLVLVLLNCGTVLAVSLDDNVTPSGGSGGIAGYIEDYEPITDEQMTSAANIASPAVSIIGKVVGVILVLVIAGVSAITALDLVYIGIPPVRGLLYSGGTTSGNSAMGNQGMGMGGMGYGSNHYGRGGMGMNGMQQPNNGQVSSFGGMQWVSDEAVDCVAQAGGSANMQQQNPSQMMPGMDGGQQPKGTKSVIIMYLKRRTVFIVIFIVCSVVLFSSAVMGTGVNIGNWIIRILEMFNGYSPS